MNKLLYKKSGEIHRFFSFFKDSAKKKLLLTFLDKVYLKTYCFKYASILSLGIRSKSLLTSIISCLLITASTDFEASG